MLNSINSTMANTAEDELFQITDKNYQILTKTVGKVKFQNSLLLFHSYMTSLFHELRRKVSEKALTADRTQFSKNHSTTVMRTVSE